MHPNDLRGLFANAVNPERADSDDHAERLLKFTIANSAALKKAFEVSLARRCEPQPWERLRNAVASLLDRTHLASRDMDWFLQTNSKLLTSVADFIGRNAPNTTRARYYRRAAREVVSSGLGVSGLDQTEMAYWRHASLVWISLWHLADIPQVTADDAEKCLDLALTLETDPKSAVGMQAQ